MAAFGPEFGPEFWLDQSRGPCLGQLPDFGFTIHPLYAYAPTVHAEIKAFYVTTGALGLILSERLFLSDIKRSYASRTPANEQL